MPMTDKDRRIAMNEIFNRIFEASGCKTQHDLAAILEIRQSSVADVKKRNIIPPLWLIKLLRLNGTNPEWIMTGQGARFLAPAGEAARPCPWRQCAAPLKNLKEYPAWELADELVQRALPYEKKRGWGTRRG